MATILSGLYSLLRGNAGLAAIIGDRITPVLLPEGQQLPAMTYQVVGGTSSPTFESAGMQKLRIQFDFFADAENGSFDDAMNARDAHRQLLNGYTGSLTDGTYLQRATLIQYIDHFDNDARQYRCSAEYYLWFVFNDSSGFAALPSLVLTDTVSVSPVTIFLANGQIMVAAGGSSPSSNPVLLDSVGGAPFTLTVDAGQLELSAGGSRGVASLSFQDTLTGAIFTLAVTSGNLVIA